MLKRLALFACFIFLPISIVHAEIPDSDWKTGTLRSIDSNSSSRLVGTLNQGNGTLIQKSTTWMYYVIDGGGYAYQGRQTLKYHWSHPLNVTIHGKIQYAIKGRNLFIVDDDGKTQKLDLVQKALEQ